MLKSYLFIPANRPAFFSAISQNKADNYIIDFEESVDEADVNTAFDSLIFDTGIPDNVYVRPFFSVSDQGLDTSFFERLLEYGFRKFVIPKIERVEHAKHIAFACGEYIDEVSCVFLVESPVCLYSLSHIIQFSELPITALILGSHDFALQMDMEHSESTLAYAHMQVLHTARAFGLKCIDSVCMDIEGTHEFEQECRRAVSFGYDGKCIVHPKQIEKMLAIEYFSQKEVQQAFEVQEYAREHPDFSVIKMHGRIYEKPHMKRINAIINWYTQYGSK
ncbi:MAG: HpcH/HpaI aldolase/citrate lyase family protein [Bacteroidota bacterium]